MADDAARLAERNYVGIEAEDIQSHIMEVVCTRPDAFERHLEHKGWLWAAFYAEAVKYCNEQVRSYEHYSAEHFYTPHEVRELLKVAYEGSVELDEMIQVTDATISMMDLQRAFDKLKLREKHLISRKYDNYGEKFTAVERVSFYRATERLAAILNRTIEEGSRARVGWEGPGGRQAMSNAQAQTMTGD